MTPQPLPDRLLALHVRLDAKLGAGFIDDVTSEELTALPEAAAALSGGEAVACHRMIQSVRRTAWIDGDVCAEDEAKLREAGFTVERAYTTPQGDGVVVPRKPTEAQRNSIYMALHYDMNVQTPDEWGAVDKAYAAMIAAAPSAKGVAK